jgi:excinuclease ABC subunit C
MKEQAAAGRFEQAAKSRDVIINIRKIFGSKNRKFTNAFIPATSGSEALNDLQTLLGLEKLPVRIECFDNSHLAGTMTVSSSVCFIDGTPARHQYRRFKIRKPQNDDTASMREVFTRHFSRKLKEGRELPALVIVDGGKGQLNAAITALIKIGCPPLPVVGLAERNEEIFIPGHAEPLILDRHRPALRLLQAIRDEAHRFAINYNRELRLRIIRDSLLDDLPGIGKKRKHALLSEFGSVKALRQVNAKEIADRVPGIGIAFAEKIKAFLSN